MCFSLEQSRFNFVVNTVCTYILYVFSTNNVVRCLVIFFWFVGLMQLFDWILWANQDLTVSQQRLINSITTKAAIIANHLQPLVLSWLTLLCFGKLGTWSIITTICYAVIAAVCTVDSLLRIKYTQVTAVSTFAGKQYPSLDWEWNRHHGWLVLYSVFFLTLSVVAGENYPSPLNMILVLLNAMTWLSAFLWVKGHYIGRFWCKIASIVPFAILVFFNKN